MSPRSRRGRPLKTTADTKLSKLRVERGLTRDEMAQLTGLSVSTYDRLEHNRDPGDINLRALANCALVLKVAVTELIEDQWTDWWMFDARYPAPPG